MREFIPALPGDLTALAFSADGRRALCADGYNAVRLWDVATRKKLRQWQLPTECSPFAFAPDGRHLAVGSKKGAIFILRMDWPSARP